MVNVKMATHALIGKSKWRAWLPAVTRLTALGRVFDLMIRIDGVVVS